jgi:hypothetical protein
MFYGRLATLMKPALLHGNETRKDNPRDQQHNAKNKKEIFTYPEKFTG